MGITVWHKIKMNHEPPQWTPSMINLDCVEVIVSMHQWKRQVFNMTVSLQINYMIKSCYFWILLEYTCISDDESFWIDYKQKWQHEIQVEVLTNSWRFSSCWVSISSNGNHRLEMLLRFFCKGESSCFIMKSHVIINASMMMQSEQHRACFPLRFVFWFLVLFSTDWTNSIAKG